MNLTAARTHGREAALAGRPIFANPFEGEQAIYWREGWRGVAEAERGTQPREPSGRVTVMLPRGRGCKGAQEWGM